MEGQFRSLEDVKYCMDATAPAANGARFYTAECTVWQSQRFQLEQVGDWRQTSF